MDARLPIRCEHGQGTLEWIGLVALVALALGAVAAIGGVGLAGADLARALAAKLVCAASLGDACDRADPVASAYGESVAAIVRKRVPDLLYEDGMAELPVDYRRCREDPCSLASSGRGEVWATGAGLAATAFTHVVDCRAEAREAAVAQGLDCDGDATGNLYVQYWLYFPDSQTRPFGEHGYHPDDWESFQVRVGAQDVAARASSHHSYNYAGGIRNWPSDAGIDTKPGWGPYAAEHHVAAGSHAGHVEGARSEPRWTPGERLELIPIEPIAAAGTDDELFEVVPPWLKGVYTDPESEQT